MATRLADLDVDLITRGHLEKGLDHLSDEFVGTFSAETVERYMAESLEALGGARLLTTLWSIATVRQECYGALRGAVAGIISPCLFACRGAIEARRPST